MSFPAKSTSSCKSTSLCNMSGDPKQQALLADGETVVGQVLYPGVPLETPQAPSGKPYTTAAAPKAAQDPAQWAWPAESTFNPTFPINHPAAGVSLYVAPDAEPAIMGPRQRHPHEIYCGNCHTRGKTVLSSAKGTLYWFAGVLSLSLTMLLGWGYDTVHECPTCHRVVGVNKSM